MSALNLEIARLGLLRMGRAATMLHVDHDVLKIYVRAGLITSVRIDWRGQMFTCVSTGELERLHRSMWPHCTEHIFMED